MPPAKLVDSQHIPFGYISPTLAFCQKSCKLQYMKDASHQPIPIPTVRIVALPLDCVRRETVVVCAVCGAELPEDSAVERQAA